uniref:CSab-Cer-3 n=1 Tax=Cercophonius squama TaxID=1330404 RepID=T1E6W8_9SCOR
MHMKFAIMFLLGMAVVGTYAKGGEKVVQKILDMIPSSAAPGMGIAKNMIKQVVHKASKNEGCAFNYDPLGLCEKNCQKESGQKGYCHGTKCKCGVPLSYK